jgi:hypothetical protein
VLKAAVKRFQRITGDPAWRQGAKGPNCGTDYLVGGADHQLLMDQRMVKELWKFCVATLRN